MKRYVIIRHGMNRANQERQEIKTLGTVLAETRDMAFEIAEARWSCYANQYFEVVEVSECATKTVNEAYHEDAMNAEVNQ
ncbi:hypothetical protein GC170_20420 [bacterium]|nr:hypothetical protein [bacterium]